MKKVVIVIVVLLFAVSLIAAEERNPVYTLAERIAGEMGDEPFVVRVAYAEMLLNRGKFTGKRKKPSTSDLRAAAAAYCNYGFSGGAVNFIKWKKAENTPLEMRSGVHLYEWFFYI